MSVLDHLGKGTVPYALEAAFVDWCIWEQARPALTLVLEKTVLSTLASEFQAAGDLASLIALSQRAVADVERARSDTGPLGLSAAKAALFEFNNLLANAVEADFDSEASAFFAARVCGWAGWAAGGFGHPDTKAKAENEAREQQAARLQSLWQGAGSDNG